MRDRYQKRPDAGGLWEVVDVITGEVAKLGGVLPLSRLDHEAVTGALDMLQNAIINSNGYDPPPSE
ncbi:hypothetical protein RFM99_10745 [Mesorhizobium sp. VK4C]|uniref:hypothetical protein n=1 Tax=Mesorhizobium captivum TaxID=3072319 RepID=UPI002A239BAC|nr:hypothetical protein [Mesorhizobium sp. VK4C]MDX8498901.1 hypothetical protein [Mesorhizobium sp. VK4C]